MLTSLIAAGMIIVVIVAFFAMHIAEKQEKSALESLESQWTAWARIAKTDVRILESFRKDLTPDDFEKFKSLVNRS